MKKRTDQIVLESYTRILQCYPSITKLLTPQEIEVVNRISSNLYNYQINDPSVICNHKMLLDSKTDILSKKLYIPSSDIRKIIMNTSTTYSEVINPVVIENEDIEQNLQSSFYIKGLESDIQLIKRQDGYYLNKFDRVKLVDNLYKVYENELKIDPKNCGIIYNFLRQQYIENLSTSELTKSRENYIQKQTLYALWEYTSKYPDNSFPSDRWILYRYKNNVLYCNDIDNTYLNSKGKLVTSDDQQYNNLQWQPVKQLIFRNKK